MHERGWVECVPRLAAEAAPVNLPIGYLADLGVQSLRVYGEHRRKLVKQMRGRAITLKPATSAIRYRGRRQECPDARDDGRL